MCVCVCVFVHVCFHQPANKQVNEDEGDSLGFHAQEPTCGSERPLLGWNTSLGPPVAEKPRWLLGRNTPTQLVPIDGSGTENKKRFIYTVVLRF